MLQGPERGETPPSRDHQVRRTETGFATRIMRLSTATAMATSPCWPDSVRERSFAPISCLYLPIAVSARLRQPYPQPTPSLLLSEMTTRSPLACAFRWGKQPAAPKCVGPSGLSLHTTHEGAGTASDPDCSCEATALRHAP
jgi:hypothetical protein